MTSKPEHPKKILVVDDMRTIQVLLPVYLVGRFYEFQSVSSAKEALEVIEDFGPDLIISDVNMPDMGGSQLCEAIRQHERFGQTPVVLMSGSVNRSELDAIGAVSKASAVVSKPIDPEKLATIVHDLLEDDD
ncbi:MAG: response regulator [Deltaproteobacteria bacterium]|nr:response regulator [Deltaproteobacteria bacterium]